MLCTCANVPMSCNSDAGSYSKSPTLSPETSSFIAPAIAPLLLSLLLLLLFLLVLLLSSFWLSFTRSFFKNAPTYACPLFFMSSNSATKVISNVLTGIIIPGIIGRRSNGIAITFLCIDSCPDETNAFGEEFEEEALPPEAAKPPL